MAAIDTDRRPSCPTRHSPSCPFAELSPAILVHLVLAAGAVMLGPVALLARKGSRPHRAFGYAWVTLMLGAALSSVFIRDFRLPNLLGYTPIHILTIVTFAGLGAGIWHITQRRIRQHRFAMRATYVGACVAGAFALLPSRTLGHLLWRQTLGWL